MPSSKQWPFPLPKGTKVRVNGLKDVTGNLAESRAGVVIGFERHQRYGPRYQVQIGTTHQTWLATHRCHPIDITTAEGLDEWLDA